MKKKCFFPAKSNEAFDKNSKDNVVSFYSAKAFDCVPHLEPLEKRIAMGVRVSLREIIFDYLKDRTQYVRIASDCSKKLNILHTVLCTSRLNLGSIPSWIFTNELLFALKFFGPYISAEGLKNFAVNRSYERKQNLSNFREMRTA